MFEIDQQLATSLKIVHLPKQLFSLLDVSVDWFTTRQYGNTKTGQVLFESNYHLAFL